MFKNVNKKNIKKVIITGIASVALVAPLALGGFNTNNAHAMSAEDQAAIQAGEQGAKEDAQEDAEAKKQVDQDNHIPSNWSISHNMDKTSANKSHHSTKSSTSMKAENEVKADKKQAERATTKFGKKNVIKHINKQAKHLKVNKRNAKSKIFKRMIENQIRDLKKLNHKERKELNNINKRLSHRSARRAHAKKGVRRGTKSEK